MKKFVSILLSMAVTLMLPSMTSCETLTNELVTMAEEMEAASATNLADGSEGYYDEEGNPIYGYDGEQAVYGYESDGSPVYDVASLSSSSTVPKWAPLKGARPQPAGIRRGGIPSNVAYAHGRGLHKPAVSRRGDAKYHRHAGSTRDAHRGDRLFRGFPHRDNRRHQGDNGKPESKHWGLSGRKPHNDARRQQRAQRPGITHPNNDRRPFGAHAPQRGQRPGVHQPQRGQRPGAGRPTGNRAPKAQKKDDKPNAARPAGRRNARG